MVDITQLLAGSMQDENDYLAQSPYFLGGVNLAKQQVAPRNNTEAFLLPLLQGLGSGALMGYGRKQAQDEAFKEYKSSPFLSTLSGYQTEERPENWTPKQGKLDIYAALLANEQNQALEIEQQKAKNDLQKTLLGKGVALSPEGGVVPISGLAEAEAQASALKKRQEIQAEKEATINALGYNPQIEEETDKMRKEFSSLPEVKNFSSVEKSASIIAKAIKDPNSVSDQELVRYSILLIEPAMAVREGEQAAVASSSSIPEKWKGALNKNLSGGTALGDDVKEGIKRLALRAYEGHKAQYDRTLGFYQEQALKKGLDKNRISYIGESQPTENVLGTTSASSIPNGFIATGRTSGGKQVYRNAEGQLWTPD